jgi:hypothetical protein
MPRVRLWENSDFGGRSFEVDTEADDIPFMVSSIEVLTEEWVYFGDSPNDQHSAYLIVYGPQRFRNLHDYPRHSEGTSLIPSPADGFQISISPDRGDWNDCIFVVKFRGKPGDDGSFNVKPTVVPGGIAVLWSDGDLSGDHEAVYPGRANLQMNDETSSVEVPSGFLLTLWENADETGLTYDFEGRNDTVPADFNDKASRYWLRRVQIHFVLPPILE